MYSQLVKKAMANRTSGSNTSGMPSWAKGVIAVAAVGVTIYVLYKINKKIQDVKEGKESKETVKDAYNEVEKYKKAGMKLSFPESNYASAVNTLVKLLSGCETFGTELQAIEEIIKVVKNPLDWSYLIAKFGKKDIPDCGWGSTNYDLPTLLKDQLDTSGVYNINVSGFKKSGFATNSREILEAYFRTRGMVL